MALTKLNARSASALDATILTGALPAISGASLTGVGKLLQISTKILSTSTAQTGSNVSTVIESDTITLSSSSNYLWVLASVNYDLQGYSATTSPSANLYLYDEADNVLTRQFFDMNISSNTYGRENVAFVQAYYSPPDTSETVRLRYSSDGTGQMRIRGNNDFTNCTRLTIAEVAT